MEFPVVTPTAPTLRRIARALISAKSTSSFSVSLSGDVSYSDSAAVVPGGLSAAGGQRGVKNPGTPNAALVLALQRLNVSRRRSIGAGAASGIPDDTRSQKRFSRSMRFSGLLPAISAALIAPIE